MTHQNLSLGMCWKLFWENPHLILLKDLCLEMSRDFSYNFGFVVEENFEHGHTRKTPMFRHLKKNSYSDSGVNSHSINSTKIEVGTLWEYSIFVQKCEAVLNMESQTVQNSRNKIGLTFNKFVIKVKKNFNQAQQNNVATFKKLPFNHFRYLKRKTELRNLQILNKMLEK